MIVERLFAHLMRSRRLVRGFERRTTSAEAMVYCSITIIMTRRLARSRAAHPGRPAHRPPARPGGVPARLSRLLTNLLDNAAKFSPAGAAVEVSLTTADLTVRDHGPGVPPEDLPYVFDRFYRSESARALPGSGLGLAMARQIARAHGAELTAENAPGGGALFRLAFGGTAS